MSPLLRFGPFELLPIERQLRRDGRVLPVGARAFDVLQALIDERGRLVTKDQLLDRVWPGLVVEESNVQVQVSALRKALGAQAIATVPGIGYRFAMALDDEAPELPRSPVAEAPPADVARGNLPLPLDPLIGREEDLRALAAVAVGQRLVSVVGPGGIGKTRLALAHAHAHRELHAHGAWFVELAALSAPEQIAPALATALRLSLVEASDEAQAHMRIAQALASQDILLVLDNCEHLVQGVVRLSRALLSSCAGLQLLATSREPLQLPGEQVFRLAPLSVPAPGTPVQEARTHGAVRLLEQRAQAVHRHFALARDNIDAAIALCRRLDGHPLAIEMAAARVPSVGMAALDARLGERLEVLHAASRDAPRRQHTMRATFDWSHTLLGTLEQTVLRRLAAFRGSFDLERAIAVAAAGEVGADAALDALVELVDKSLVKLERLDPPRYRLSEMTRLYALEKLAAAGEVRAAEQRHGQAMAERAEHALDSFWRSSDAQWIPAIAGDADDLQAAVDRALAAGDPDVAAPALELLMRLDTQRGIDATLQARMRAALALLPHAQGVTRARLLQLVAPKSPIVLPELVRVDAARDAVQAWRALNDPARLCESLLALAYELAVASQFDEAEAALAEARALEDPAWGARRRQAVPNCASSLAHWRGDMAQCLADTRAALALAQAAGDALGTLRHRLNLANVLLLAGDAAASVAFGAALVADLDRTDAPALLAMALGNLCAAQLRTGDLAGALTSAARSLSPSWLHGQAGFLLDHAVLLAARRGQCRDAARLLGFADAWYGAQRHERETNELQSVRDAIGIAVAALGDDDFAREHAAGATMDDAQAQALAREVLGATGAP